MAAIAAGSAGRRTLLCEKMPSPGRKLLLTGNGRCNLTNTGDREQFIGHFSATGPFLRNCFAAFFNDSLRAFFTALGVRLREEEGGKIYPASGKARDILGALLHAAQKNGVAVRPGEEIAEIIVRDGAAAGVVTARSGAIAAAKVVVCAGGMTYPQTGSSGSGYELARRCGHRIVEPRPALAPLYSDDPAVAGLQGVSLRNVEARVTDGARIHGADTGDILFTHNGLSGPAALNVSGDVYDHLRGGAHISLLLNFRPGTGVEGYEKLIAAAAAENPVKSVKNLLRMFFPDRFAAAFVAACGVDGERKASQVSREDRRKIAERLFGFRIMLRGTGGAGEAMVTRGGVSVDEVNPKTMESKLVKRLHFAGELLDIDGKSGGYNLQAAFSTGYAAGMA